MKRRMITMLGLWAGYSVCWAKDRFGARRFLRKAVNAAAARCLRISRPATWRHYYHYHCGVQQRIGDLQGGHPEEHNLDFALTHLFGAGKLLFGKDDGQELTRAKFSGENQFGGQAQTTNSGKLTAQMSAILKEVMTNGNLLIEGRRAIFYNKEKKNIVVSGIIRPQDVTSENTVLSTYVADASIVFEGQGEVNNQSQPGILSKLLGWIPIF